MPLPPLQDSDDLIPVAPPKPTPPPAAQPASVQPTAAISGTPPPAAATQSDVRPTSAKTNPVPSTVLGFPASQPPSAPPTSTTPTTATQPAGSTGDDGDVGPTSAETTPLPPTIFLGSGSPPATTATPSTTQPTSAATDPGPTSAKSTPLPSRYYTFRADAEANLRPGQKVGFTRGRGYYDYYPSTPTPPATTPEAGGGGGGGGSGSGGSGSGDGGTGTRVLASAPSQKRRHKSTSPLRHHPGHLRVTGEGTDAHRYQLDGAGVQWDLEVAGHASLTWGLGTDSPEVKVSRDGMLDISDGPLSFSSGQAGNFAQVLLRSGDVKGTTQTTDNYQLSAKWGDKPVTLHGSLSVTFSAESERNAIGGGSASSVDIEYHTRLPNGQEATLSFGVEMSLSFLGKSPPPQSPLTPAPKGVAEWEWAAKAAVAGIVAAGIGIVIRGFAG